MATTTFSTPDPPLLTPLLTSAARAQGLRAHGGHCLNCNGTDHSMKTCNQEYLNTSGILNPALGQLNDVATPTDNGNNACAHTTEDSTSGTWTATITATTATTTAPTTTFATTAATTDPPTTGATTMAARTAAVTTAHRDNNRASRPLQPPRRLLQRHQQP